MNLLLLVFYIQIVGELNLLQTRICALETNFFRRNAKRNKSGLVKFKRDLDSAASNNVDSKKKILINLNILIGDGGNSDVSSSSGTELKVTDNDIPVYNTNQVINTQYLPKDFLRTAIELLILNSPSYYSASKLTNSSKALSEIAPSTALNQTHSEIYSAITQHFGSLFRTLTYIAFLLVIFSSLALVAFTCFILGYRTSLGGKTKMDTMSKRVKNLIEKKKMNTLYSCSSGKETDAFARDDEESIPFTNFISNLNSGASSSDQNKHFNCDKSVHLKKTSGVNMQPKMANKVDDNNSSDKQKSKEHSNVKHKRTPSTSKHDVDDESDDCDLTDEDTNVYDECPLNRDDNYKRYHIFYNK